MSAQNPQFSQFLQNPQNPQNPSLDGTLDKGPETTWNAEVIGAGSSAEKALGNLVTDIYNVAFSTYLTNHSK